MMIPVAAEITMSPKIADFLTSMPIRARSIVIVVTTEGVRYWPCVALDVRTNQAERDHRGA